eukprot:gnl/MRDRNA2_/MRDRNA2_105641_c0_seq1.p1 gnl/MRDRNA2_/MRDRNA2_105641_c0~~gnl/MRDRNA2_/MRDRNA2_105641_c0_seq1.p1  ORF type:complete len:618 (+),score=103.14 gnl/MRDRNA2_/MRDRNA2_105641_c0_seq1:90-1856(+)
MALVNSRAKAAVAAFARGEFVIVLHGGDQDKSVCGLTLAAQHATVERLAFMIRYSTGIINVVTDKRRLEHFGLHPATSDSSSSLYVSTNFTPDTTLGASASDRAATLRAFCNDSNKASDFSKPGHIFPIAVREGGVLDSESSGHPDATYELCKLSAALPVGALAEMMHDDGTMLQHDDCLRFAQEHGILTVTRDQLIEYRRFCNSEKESEAAKVRLESESLILMDDIQDECRLRIYSTPRPDAEVVAVIKGEVQDQERVPVRVHSECFTGDILGSQRCDCGQQLHRYLKIIDTLPCGILIYVRGHEGRGIGLANKIKAYKLQDEEGLDTVDANLRLGFDVDERCYKESLAALRHIGVKSICLFTNNPEKVNEFADLTAEVKALPSIPCQRNIGYLQTKAAKCGHRTVLETFKLPRPKETIVAKAKIGIVYTSWNSYFVNELLREAENALNEVGAKQVKMKVPGASELVSGARAMLRKSKPDAVIVLGVVIRGASDSYDFTCGALMEGLTQLNANQDVPVIQGLLMCRDEDQARERSHGPNNAARAWAETALHMISIMQDSDGEENSGEDLPLGSMHNYAPAPRRVSSK